MNDYYEILKLKVNSTENKIYRTFKKKLEKGDLELENIQILFKAYKVLSGPQRKFYDILISQKLKGEKLNVKYSSIIKQIEDNAIKLANYYLIEIKKNNSILKRARTESVILDFFLGIIGVDWSTSISFGSGLILFGVIITGYSLSLFNVLLITIGVFLFTIGILLIRKGLTDFERENFNKLTLPS